MNLIVSEIKHDSINKNNITVNHISITTQYDLNVLKKGIWLYLILLIFEGALRKWLLPGLSDAILIIRDPVAIILIFYASVKNLAFSNFYVKSLVVITLLCFITALTVGHHNLIVAIYGCRLTLIHFPLVFLIGKVLTKEDVILFGKFFIYLCMPMTLLIALQFYSPQSAWVNRGVGGNVEGAGFSGNGLFFRPPGTFSFTSGNTSFYSFVIPFLFYFAFFNQTIKRIFIIGSIIAVILAIPLSISRSLFFSFLISLIFVLISFYNNARQIGKILGVILLIGLAIFLLSKTSIFETSLGAFIDRFTQANEVEGGVQGVLLDRFLGGLLKAIASTVKEGNTFFGYGIGYGSNVAAKLVTGSADVFLVAEEEWARTIGEVGAFFGLLIIFVRVKLAFFVLNNAWKWAKKNEPLSWLLCSYSFLVLLQGGWAQPTSLGFFVVSGGFTLASLKKI